jgi:hypothetical protein
VLLTTYGVYIYAGLNLDIDTLPTSVYCFAPMLSLPVFLLSFWRHRLSAGLQVLMAVLFVTAYSLLNWRTCSELGYCGSVAATVGITLTAHASVAMLAVAITNLAALFFRGQLPPAQK